MNANATTPDQWRRAYRRRIAALGFDPDCAERVFGAVHDYTKSPRLVADQDAEHLQAEIDAADDYEDRKARL